jgi:Kef-type K+ transport system membrane component KefB
MMLWLGGLSLVCHVTRQSNIVAALVIGLIVGGVGWDESMHLNVELNDSFIELGNVLVLFFAGLSTHFSSFTIYWKQICLIAMAKIIIYIGVFAGIGIGLGLCQNEIASVYFGLSCALSSTILVKDHFTRTGEERQLHAKILNGVLILQDMVAAFSFVIIEAFHRLKRSPYHSLYDVAIAPPAQHSMHDLFVMDRASFEVGRSVGILFALLAVLAFFNRFLLDRAFRIFRREADMLFIGSMAYNFGISAVCQLVGFSPMAGAYLAGLSLSILPTRTHIASKIASLRGFGMTNFYFMLGIAVHLDGASLRRLAPPAALLAALVLLAMPAASVLATRSVPLRGRTRFYVATAGGCMGELSLIVQILALQAGIFDRDTHIGPRRRARARARGSAGAREPGVAGAQEPGGVDEGARGGGAGGGAER